MQANYVIKRKGKYKLNERPSVNIRSREATNIKQPILSVQQPVLLPLLLQAITPITRLNPNLPFVVINLTILINAALNPWHFVLVAQIKGIFVAKAKRQTGILL
jgi:hypothetical protein